MENFEIIDNGLVSTMSQSTAIVFHSFSALLVVLGVIGTICCIISLIRKDENPILCIVAFILCLLFLLLSIFAPFGIKEENLIHTYKVKPTADATVEDVLDFVAQYEIITEEDDWYIVYER